MAGYDTLTLSSIAVPNDGLRLTTPQPGHTIAMDGFDRDLGFDGDSLLDDVNTGVPSIQFTPTYELSDAFSTTFEDPFSYQSGSFDGLLDETGNENGETNQHDLDNKLLGFGPPIMKVAILDDGGQTWPNMSAELYGMFFVAEDVFGGDSAGRPMELTCYRRNLFQISGTITLSRTISQILNEQGQQLPIYDLTASLSAIESIEGKPTEIISVPWKTAAASSSEDKAGAAPPKWPLDLTMSPELDPACVSVPIAWKRLQFKHATANNGRRKGLQQHYIIQINLTATSATGDSVKLAEIQSGPIIVRGRSPRNFDSRKDVPLSERKLEPKARTMGDGGASSRADPPQQSYRMYALNALQQPLDIPDWASASPLTTDVQPRQAKKASLATSTESRRPPVPKTRWKNEPVDMKPVLATAPIDLSLTEEESGRGHSSGISTGLPIGSSTNTSPITRKIVSSPVESADLLYEYFPLSLDDWMAPVDAIYRPHVVHHTIVPPELKAQSGKNKTKRYFTADD